MFNCQSRQKQKRTLEEKNQCLKWLAAQCSVSTNGFKHSSHVSAVYRFSEARHIITTFESQTNGRAKFFDKREPSVPNADAKILHTMKCYRKLSADKHELREEEKRGRKRTKVRTGACERTATEFYTNIDKNCLQR